MSDTADKSCRRDDVYTTAALEYESIDDVPYDLDESKLRYMQKMERALSFIIENLGSDMITLERAAKASGMSPSYFERAFRAYFEMPFVRFVTKLQLRQAARDVKTGEYAKGRYEQYGFSMLPAFSRSFKKEFGVKLQEFKRDDYDIPSMPDRKVVQGIKIRKEYVQQNAAKISGIAIDPIDQSRFCMIDDCACMYMEHVRDRLEHDSSTRILYDQKSSDTVGAWWYVPDSGLKYIAGKITESYDTIFNATAKTTVISGSAGQNMQDPLISVPGLDIVIQGGNYVKFTCDRPEKDEDIRLVSRILWRYVFREWIPMNRKLASNIGCTYEKLSEDRISLYVPLLSNFWNSDDLKPHTWSVANWANYIDEHITDGLSLQSLAHIVNYSPQNYKEIFSMYYGITPTQYIKRRRIFLAIHELERSTDEGHRRNILRKYRFTSLKKLRHAAIEEFGSDRAKDEEGRAQLPDLNAFYQDNKGRVRSGERMLTDLPALLYSVKDTDKEGFPDDLVERVLYYFHREFDDYQEVKSSLRKPEVKIFIWSSEPVMVDRRPVYQYYIGSLLQPSQEGGRASLTDNTMRPRRHVDTVTGGRYAVFSTYDKDDESSPREAFQLLMRCAFGGWICNNRWRVDLKRRTFVMWKKHKLYFYVPLLR